jgi:hypothetical protein
MGVVEYIFNQLAERVEKILPVKELNRMPDISGIDDSHRALSDLVFVTERYLNTKVLPINWEIIKSSQLNFDQLSKESIENYNNLISLLEKGDLNLNSNTLGFIPKSSRRYFDTFEGDSEKRRYLVDFTNQFFGIKHFHLDSHNTREDNLLYYVTVKSQIYFLSIGGHSDLYTDRNLKILIKEFDFLLPALGIGYMPDMPMGKNPNYSVDDIKNMWISGSNVTFIVNEKYYTSNKLQTPSRLNTEIIQIVQNIYCEVETGLQKFIEQSLYKDFIVSSEQDYNDLYNGTIKLTLPGSTNNFELVVNYLALLPLIDLMLDNSN